MAGWSRSLGIIAVAGCVAGLAGCGSSDAAPDVSTFDMALERNSTFKNAVAELQLELADADWDVRRYGDYPRRCDGGYYFEMERYVPVDGEEWRIPGGFEQFGADAARWLESNGFSGGITTHDGLDVVSLTAANPDAGIEELVLRLVPGEVSDGMSLIATSECFPGDSEALIDEMYPDATIDSTGVDYPAVEHPTEVPLFGDPAG